MDKTKTLKNTPVDADTRISNGRNGAPDNDRFGADVATLTALRDGDHAAFERIYLHGFSSMRRFLTMLMQSESVAEELTQDVFASIWESRGKIDPEGNFKAFLYKIAKAAAFNMMRRRKVEQKYVDFITYSSPEFDLSPDEQYANAENEMLVNLVLANMPPQRRTIFEMSRIKGMSHAEIAKELNISSETVRKHLQYAMKDFSDLTALLVTILVMP